MNHTVKVFSASLICLLLITADVFCEETDTDNPDTVKENQQPTAVEDWELVWADEFDYEGLPDPKKWTFDIQKPGWRNKEKQYYAKRLENARVEKGNLIIEADNKPYENYQYTSASIKSQYKGDFIYGKIEVKAKLPKGRGTWPAIWMMPTALRGYGAGWPSSGEIDIMEHVGYDPGVIHASIHCKKYNWRDHSEKTKIIKVKDVFDEYHVYTLYWYTDHIEIAVDGKKYFRFENENKSWIYWPFDKRFYLILNIAIGGEWGGIQGIDESIFPARMVVDYVRVYRLKESSGEDK
ncbi:MAG: glycoside hydrolase family 16 protein [Spirochaetales bacterium]|nr:glycoside hydrolase family 16 protein [Spirochaetales bacterium]